jgi:hypothetical protein
MRRNPQQQIGSHDGIRFLTLDCVLAKSVQGGKGKHITHRKAQKQRT